MEGGAGGGDVVDEPEVFAGEAWIGAAGECTVEIFDASRGGVDLGLRFSAADAFHEREHLPVAELSCFASEFFRLIETAPCAARPMQRHWDEGIDGDGARFGSCEHRLIEKGCEDASDFPGSAEFQAMHQCHERFRKSADAGGESDAGIAFSATATSGAGVVGCMRSGG